MAILYNLAVEQQYILRSFAMPQYYEILSPMRNFSMRATRLQRGDRHVVDIEDSDADGEYINVYTGEFVYRDLAQAYWNGFVKAVHLMDQNAEVRRVESFPDLGEEPIVIDEE
jgi:hypothetical protein